MIGARILMCALSLAVAACAASPDNRYYELTPAHSEPADGMIAQPQLSLTVPAWLDRPQIVVQSGDGQVDIREFDRWAEPPDSMIRRVLTQDIAASLPPRAPRRSVAVTIDDFAFAPDKVNLAAHWTVGQDAATVIPVSAHAFTRAEPVAQGDLSAAAAAMSRLLNALAQQIAARLR